MKSIIQFKISHEDGFYAAGGINASIVSEGSTFEELQEKQLTTSRNRQNS